jgi:hypothetical protein
MQANTITAMATSATPAYTLALLPDLPLISSVESFISAHVSSGATGPATAQKARAL